METSDKNNIQNNNPESDELDKSEEISEENAESPTAHTDSSDEENKVNDLDPNDESTDIEENLYTTDEDDIAYVAERITGARHSIVTTAAPIRVRENKDTIQMNSLKRIMEDHASKKVSGTPSGHKRIFFGIIAAVAVIITAMASVIVGVNIANDKNRPADINIGEASEDTDGSGEQKDDNILNNDNESDTLNSGEAGDGITDTDILPDTDASAESEPEPETELEPIPEVEKFNVTLDFYDREDIEVSTERIMLSELLELCEVTLAEGEVPSVSLDSTIAADIVINIDKYEYETVSETFKVPYKSQRTETDLIPRGEKKYTQYGEEGQVNKYYNVEYVNGKETNRTFSYEETVKAPVNEIYEEGVGGSFVGADGINYTYSHRRVVPATYYNIEGLTYLGTMADESVIAVDKDNIPLGTKLYVKNDTYDFGVRIASDIGGQIDEWEVDIWLSKDNPYYPSFSQAGYVYDMEIYYID